MWFVFALLAAVMGTFYALLARFLLKGKGDPMAFALILQFVTALTILMIMPFEKVSYDFSPINMLLIIIVGVGTALIAKLFIEGRQMEEASNVSIAAQVGGIWSILGGAVILGEALTPYKIIGALLIIFGNLLVFLRKGKIQLTKGMKTIVIASILFSTATFGDKYVLRTFSPALYNVLVYFLSSLSFLIVARFDFRRVRKEIALQGPLIFLASAVFGVGIYLFEKAVQMGEVSRVFLVNNTSIVLTVLLGILLLKERENIFRKIVAAIMVFIGAYLLMM